VSTTEGQRAPNVPRVGFLTTLGSSSSTFEAFRQGLSELGYVENQNVVIEPRFADGQYERFPELTTELIRLKVDVIALLGAVTARAVKKIVTDLPVVFAIVVDPVADNVVTSMAHPGGNITGATTFDPQQPRKQLQLLKEAIPCITRVGILGDEGISQALMNANEEQARALGLETQRFRVAAPNPDLEGAFAVFRVGHVDAVLVLEEPVPVIHAKRIAELAAEYRIPTMFSPVRADAGGLIAYGTSLNEGMRRMGSYIDKILKGAKPGDLPVERVTRYELIVNLNTARQIGVTFPAEVLKRADRIINEAQFAGRLA
jgi:putative tryptophan/tyrosine transport system substrate-binding protein